jgi:hypothetical protein
VVVLYEVSPFWHGVWAAFRDEVPEISTTKIDPEKYINSTI